jgi:hypothetical protein
LKHKKSIILAVSIFLIFIISVFLSQTTLSKAILARYKSTDHFATLPEDPRIRYETPAHDNAIALSQILSGSQKNVESILKADFKRPIEAYVCSSQESFNEYVSLSKNVKGAVYWGKFFLSPAAFSQGKKALSELTTHELTHYLFYTHLGEKAHLEHVPLWFREGVAVFVADGGAKYTKDSNVSSLMTAAEKDGFLSGKTRFWFASKNPRDAVTKNGTANWLLYRVGALFVHYMHDVRPDSFDKLIQLLLSGTKFNEAVEISYGKTIETLLGEFSQYLSAANQQT